MIRYSNNKGPNTRPAASNASQARSKSVFIQTKLTVGKPNDAYEQEADRVADKVVSQENSQQQSQASAPLQIQAKCAACEGEEKVQKMGEDEEVQAKPISQIQKQEEEEVQAKPMPLVQREEKEEMQMKTQDGKQTASADVSHQIHQSRGSGSPMPAPIQQQMESSIGADFRGVRIHTGSKAESLSQSLNAQAFTVGNDIYFNKGKYSPESASGKHLLAHELTHTVQQGASLQRMIQKQDSPDPLATDEDGYTFGRAPHDHRPGNWAAVQALADANCTALDTKLVNRAIECVCANSTPAEVMDYVLSSIMSGETLATEHLNYYLAGTGEEFDEDANLITLINTDQNVRNKLIQEMKTAIDAGVHSGHFMISQGDYQIKDFQLAFGGIDRVDWRYWEDSGTVDVWFKDPYDFHPIYDGLYHNFNDPADARARPSNCVHAAAVEMQTESGDTGAKPFIMRGWATFNYNEFDMAAPAPQRQPPPATVNDLAGEGEL